MARPSLRIVATCTDDDPAGCASLTVSPGGATGDDEFGSVEPLALIDLETGREVGKISPVMLTCIAIKTA